MNVERYLPPCTPLHCLYIVLPSFEARRRTAASSFGNMQCCQVQEGKYLLRPETIESLFWLWRRTGNATADIGAFMCLPT